MYRIEEYCSRMQPEVEQFYRESFHNLGWEYEPNGRHADIADITKNYMNKGCFWCMYEEERLIGTVAIRILDEDGKTAELKRLYVTKDEQGKGYGKVLFEKALCYANEKKFQKVYADTRYDRAGSQHLMRTHGFHETKRYNENAYAQLFFELDREQNEDTEWIPKKL